MFNIKPAEQQGLCVSHLKPKPTLKGTPKVGPAQALSPKQQNPKARTLNPISLNPFKASTVV